LAVIDIKAPPFYQGMTRPRFADEKAAPDSALTADVVSVGLLTVAGVPV
jgi:hypothetical protein